MPCIEGYRVNLSGFFDLTYRKGCKMAKYIYKGLERDCYNKECTITGNNILTLSNGKRFQVDMEFICVFCERVYTPEETKEMKERQGIH